MGLTADSSKRDTNTSVTKPVFNSFGIIAHKVVPDSYIVQFKDEMVVLKARLDPQNGPREEHRGQGCRGKQAQDLKDALCLQRCHPGFFG